LDRNQDNVSEWIDMSIRGLFDLMQTSSSSHQNVTCSDHDMSEKLFS